MPDKNLAVALFKSAGALWQLPGSPFSPESYDLEAAYQMKRTLFAALLLLLPLSAKAETPEEWVALGARVHGAFGAFIPLGIKIGLDAMKRLDAKPRALT